ncbi:hypothetical protein ANN_07859 [Periplaneta americana]|uniref:Uncharacterized protein n=1 Tax=Periplaneta americana TaxID=6978 RepID=A0ABQ8T125_PERAM|nr:hypothetical protein ANN_07859 [Periplaneta americana]
MSQRRISSSPHPCGQRLEGGGLSSTTFHRVSCSRLPTVVVDVRARLELSPHKSLRRLSQEAEYIFKIYYRAGGRDVDMTSEQLHLTDGSPPPRDRCRDTHCLTMPPSGAVQTWQGERDGERERSSGRLRIQDGYNILRGQWSLASVHYKSGSTYRLTGPRYLTLRQEVLVELCEDLTLALRQQIWFQHDGAPAHFSLAIREHLHQTFRKRWIGKCLISILSSHSWLMGHFPGAEQACQLMPIGASARFRAQESLSALQRKGKRQTKEVVYAAWSSYIQEWPALIQ